MELELGLKLIRDADEFSSADFLLAKHRDGPLFISTESETMFILTAHLKGYRRQNMKIEINEDGTLIIVRGEKFVQETIMVGWQLQRKETVKREFHKAFKIPDGVILDKIKAKFDDDESLLTISIPKKEKGIRGLVIHEVKEPEISRAGSENLQIAPGDTALFPQEPEIENAEKPEETAPNVVNPEERKETQQEVVEEMENSPGEAIGEEPGKSPVFEEMKNSPGEAIGEEPGKSPVFEEMKNSPGEAIGEEPGKSRVFEEELEKKPVCQITEEKLGGENDHNKCPHDLKKNGIEEEEDEEVESAEKGQSGGSVASRSEEERRRCKLCTPILAGSALFLSIVAFVVHYIRTRSQPGKRDN